MTAEDRKLYGTRADLYDLIYTKIDYAAYAARLGEILAAEGVAGSARILEAACGTGAYLKALSPRYRMTGFDEAEAMLEISRRKNPDVPHFRADMADFTVEEPFDAVLCLFSSIGYLHGEERLRSGLRCFAKALSPGGTLVIEPWISRESFREGNAHLDTFEGDTVKVARASYSMLHGDRAAIDFEWVVTRAGEGLDRFRERHELWFCPAGLMREALSDAGLRPRFEAEGLVPGRGLWIAKPGP